jgi:hypothetical protein
MIVSCILIALYRNTTKTLAIMYNNTTLIQAIEIHQNL